MIAFSRYKKNPCQLRAQNAFTSQNTPPIARTQPSARIENVVAVCALTIHIAPRAVSRTPNMRNQPQDFLTCSRPATRKSETSVIVVVLSCIALLSLSVAARLNRSLMQENLGSILRNRDRCCRFWIGVELSKNRWILAE